MSIKLILSDIDGTLLPFGQKRLSPRVFEAFHAALDAGIHIGPASGRALSGVLPVFEGDTACTRTASTTNGMEVYLDGELIHRELIPPAAIETIYAYVKTHPRMGLICFEEGEPHLLLGDVEILAPLFPAYAAHAKRRATLPDWPVTKVNIFVDDADEKATLTHQINNELAALIPEVDFVVPMPGFINVLSKNWGKGSAIDLLCERLGISLDEVVVFGDAENDLQMIEHVPNSVAVANAVERVRAAACWQIGSVDEDAVPNAILALAEGLWPFQEA